MADAIFQVTPGLTVTVDTNMDPAALNALGRPTVTAPANSIPPDALMMAELITAILTGAGDSLRGRSYLDRGVFAAEDWTTPEGAEVSDGVAGENATGWSILPAGGAVTVARGQDSPDRLSTWCAQLTGSAGVTSADYFTFVPSAVAGSLRDAQLTFSVWLKNLHSATAQVRAFVSPASSLNSRAVVALASTGPLQALPPGVWTRVIWTFDTTGMANVANGFRIGLSTAFLDSSLKSLLVAQAQLEAAAAANTFMRPPAALTAGLGLRASPLTAADRALGAFILVQLANGEWRTLPAPANSLGDSVLGWNDTGSYPEWRAPGDAVEIFDCRNADQRVTCPADGFMTVHVWGAGASHDGDKAGGVGGYSWGVFRVVKGQEMAVMVGQGGYGLNYRPYGSGGAQVNANRNGGGLSGLFINHDPVVANQQARAIIVAGGGGASHIINNSGPAGGNGNDPGSTGGSADMGGSDAWGNEDAGDCGGGGGYIGGGGGGINRAGRGGTGYLNTDPAGGRPTLVPGRGALEYTPRNPVPPQWGAELPPGTGSPHYQTPAAKSDGSGLIVILWNEGLGAPGAPEATTDPAVTGSLTTGATLTCTTGVWSPAPTAYEYEWFVGGDKVGDTDDAHVIQAGDSGKTIHCRVSAFNAQGFGVRNSNTVTAA